MSTIKVAAVSSVNSQSIAFPSSLGLINVYSDRMRKSVIVITVWTAAKPRQHHMFDRLMAFASRRWAELERAEVELRAWLAAIGGVD